MKSLIIGNGEIGSALLEIFSKAHETYARDLEPMPLSGVEVLHIAYPYSDDFVDQTKAYIAEYKPRLTMIHSTVPVGTTDLCGEHVVHSPERGRFPHLAKQMVYFKKFIGGRNRDDLNMAAGYILACQWKVALVTDPTVTEALKLISNAHMGLEIAWRQEMARCGVKAEEYTAWEESYFHGYMTAGDYNLLRPRMKADPIGGHCILQSVELLSKSMKSPLLEYVHESNERTKREKEAQAVGA